MQVTPALPWGPTTEGGVIKLKKAVTYQDLLDGILRWTLDKNETDEVGQVVAGEVGDRSLYISNTRGDKVYTIAAFTDPTNRLTLTRHADAPADTSLKSAVFNTDAVRTYPTMPWAAGTGGRIIFKEPITIQDLLDGQVVLGLNYNGEPADNVRFYQQQGSDSVQVMSGGNTVFGVTLENNVLYLNYIYQDNGFNLANVSRTS